MDHAGCFVWSTFLHKFVQHWDDVNGVQTSILKLLTVPAEVYILTSHSHECDLSVKINPYFKIRQLLLKKMNLSGYTFFVLCLFSLSGVGKHDQDGSGE